MESNQQRCEEKEMKHKITPFLTMFEGKGGGKSRHLYTARKRGTVSPGVVGTRIVDLVGRKEGKPKVIASSTDWCPCGREGREEVGSRVRQGGTGVKGGGGVGGTGHFEP